MISERLIQMNTEKIIQGKKVRKGKKIVLMFCRSSKGI